MTPINMSDPVYHDEDAARRHFEAVRWPNGPVCPHCGVADQSRELGGKSMGPGWFYCAACQDKFTVRTGTVWERSHIPLHKWLLASRMMASSKKGVSAHQLHRTLGITYKSAWFLAHRIREAMIDTDPTPLGGEGKIIEADETFYGPKEYAVNRKTGKYTGKQGTSGKAKIVTLVERKGRARSVKVEDLTTSTIGEILANSAATESRLMTDEAGHYSTPGSWFAKHERVKHGASEYVRGDVTTNTVEGFFSIFKRGMTGVYQHCGEQHLQRYLAEFDFRYSNRAALGVDDAERTTRTLRGAEGKRLTYRRPDKRASAQEIDAAGV